MRQSFRHRIRHAQVTPTTDEGLRLRLSTAAPELAPPEATPLAAPQPLPPDRLAALLARLAPLEPRDGDRPPFRFPAATLPPPRPGKTVETPFPPPAQPAPPDAPQPQPLAVRGHAPEGDVPLAAQFSVTFSQPMVPVASVEDLAARDVPVQISPQPPGTWRWLGTKTLLLRSTERFPMATRYAVEIPAATRSQTGGTLAEAVRWTFTTPAPKLLASYPVGISVPRHPVIFLAFDQKIDPEAVLATIRLATASNISAIALRLATADEVGADAGVQAMLKSTVDGRWLALRTEEPLPAGEEVRIRIGPGTPSAEGPLKTDASQEIGFSTYGPLKIVDHSCRQSNECPPGSPFSVRFSNPLDAASVDPSAVSVEPPLPGMIVEAYGETLLIRGRSKAHTEYRLTFATTIRDVFAQSLDKPVTITVRIGQAYPQLVALGGEMVVLDPKARPRYSVYSISHRALKVQVYAVGPGDFDKFRQFLRSAHEGRQDRPAPQPPGRRVVSGTLNVKGPIDELTETAIDLTPALSSGLGHAIVIVEPATPPRRGEFHPVLRAWVQSTKIGLTALNDRTELIAWATSLADGTPLANVELTLEPTGERMQSGADGTARTTLPATGEGPALLIARQANDVAILPENLFWWHDSSGWVQQSTTDELRWFVFDDRRMYRPGENVHLKGWLRRVGQGENGDVAELPLGDTRLDFVFTDPQGNELTKGSAVVGPAGGFDLKLTLPRGANLGTAQLQLTAQGAASALAGTTHVHSVEVQDFRRPEFEVTTTPSVGPYFVGEHATVTARAAYYAGGPLPGAATNWRVSATPGSFTPPNRDDFIFGIWTPWWWVGPALLDEGGFRGRMPWQQGNVQATLSAQTDSRGEHTLRIDFDAVDPPRAMNVEAAVDVTDVNRQQWSASSSLLVHPANLYVGIRSPRTFVEQGMPIDVEAIVCDLDGRAVPDRKITLQLTRLETKYQGGMWKEEEIDEPEQSQPSAAEPVTFRFDVKEPGRYRVRATILDDRERKNLSEFTVWVAGEKLIPSRRVEQEKVELIPNQKDYRAGDIAEILIRAPFAPAEALISVNRSGTLHQQRFRMETATHTLRVPIEEAHVPNLEVQVELVGAAPRVDLQGRPDAKLPPRPAYASGSLTLSIPPRARTLAVQVTPQQSALEPGADTAVDVQVTAPDGQAVADAEICLVAVDEAILSLTGYRIPDPLAAFYTPRPAGVSTRHQREYVVLGRADDLDLGALEEAQARGAASNAMPAAAPMEAMTDSSMLRKGRMAFAADGAGGGAPPPPIAVRQDFNPLAAFVAVARTNADGHVRVPVKLPDNLTRYRVTVVAVAGTNRFGRGENTITARLPLMVRPSAPRFLNFGDHCELPVVLQNQTDAPLAVDVGLRATNVTLDDAPSPDGTLPATGNEVTVPAGDRIEVRFPITTQQPGEARFQIAAAAGPWSDAAQFSLPVYTPATTEAFATYGELDDGTILQTVQPPSDAIAGFGGLELSTSSTALAALSDAVLYLVQYPFECAEQVSSRVLAIAALKDVLAAFNHPELPRPEILQQIVRRDLDKLAGMQNPDGGFGFWRAGDVSWPYLSIHVAHALARARQKDYAIPEPMWNASQQYLHNIEQLIPPEYGLEVRTLLATYAAFVLELMGEDQAPHARELFARQPLDKLPLESAGFLLAAMSGDADSATQLAALRRHLANRATETADTAHFVTGYDDTGYLVLHSDRRADAVILEALIRDEPTHDLIPKLARGLLAHRKKGRWDNTQENCFVLLALDRYFATYERQTPDFVARAWLGNQYAAEHRFAGRSADRQEVQIPFDALAANPQPTSLLLAKEGPGRLYYRLGMRYAPTSLQLAPADYGFYVERKYEALDPPDAVRRDDTGTWHIRAGARVRVRITMVAPDRRYHVALVDPLPAGLEAVNAALAVSPGPVPQDPGPTSRERRWWWWGPWYEHHNLRDQRAEAFTSLLWGGVYEFTYDARATTPGDFVVPPAKAEEMYAPETFGRSATDRVIIE